METATHLLRREWRWAFDEVRSLRWGAAFRFNHDVVQGTDLFSATTPNGTGEQLGLQVAYVHDDTRSPRLNIRHGLRARVWAEMFVDGVATASAAGGELTGPDQGWTFGTVGFDARRYVPLVGPSILAFGWPAIGALASASCCTCSAGPTTACPSRAAPTPR